MSDSDDRVQAEGSDQRESSSSAALRTLRKNRQRFWIVLGVSLGVLSIPLLLVLTATVFVINLAPQEAQANATYRTTTAGAMVFGSNVFLFVGGETGLEINAEGFHPYKTSLRRSESTSLDVTLVPLPGLANIVVNTSHDVEIKVDGTTMGVGRQLSLELAAGTHEIALSSSRIEPYESTIEVKGFGESQEFVITPIDSTSFLSVNTIPADATIELDGQILANPSVNTSIGIGSHFLVVNAPDHASTVRQFVTKQDDVIDLGTIELDKDPVVVDVETTPSSASLFIHGKYLASTPTTLRLQPNVEHELTIVKPSYVESTTTVFGKPGESIYTQIELVKEQVAVQITSNVIADIAVNGQLRGQTPLNIDVVDNARVSASRTGYLTETKEIRITDGIEQSLYMELLTPTERKDKDAPDQVQITNDLVLQKFVPRRYIMAVSSEGWSSGQPTNNQKSTINVAITRPFYLSQNEVTVKDFRSFSGQSKSESGEERLPITDVTWIQAAEFCNWLSKEHELEPVYVIASRGVLQSVDESALGFRLPTEIEWLAAYANQNDSPGVKERFPWGSSAAIPRAFGNFAGREASTSLQKVNYEYVDNHASVAPIASYRANHNRIHDLAGNVSEWIHDYYELWPEVDSLTDYTGPKTGLDHVVRGGNFMTAESKDLAFDSRRFLNTKEPTVGFRVARWIH